jgi:hypothetical protein
MIVPFTASVAREVLKAVPPSQRDDGSWVFLAAPHDAFDRENPEGHVTGSAVIARPDGSAFLLILHRKLGRWLQPGGHLEPSGSDGERSAGRAERESQAVNFELSIVLGLLRTPAWLEPSYHLIAPVRSGSRGKLPRLKAHRHPQLRAIQLPGYKRKFEVARHHPNHDIRLPIQQNLLAQNVFAMKPAH